MILLREKFGTADDYLEVFDEKMNESEGPVIVKYFREYGRYLPGYERFSSSLSDRYR